MQQQQQQIDPSDLIYYSNEDKNIYSGGFSVNSILLKSGMAPYTTATVVGGGTSSKKKINNVSDMFDNLVVPNLMYTMEPMDPIALRNATATTATAATAATVPNDLYDKLYDLISVKPSLAPVAPVATVVPVPNKFSTTRKRVRFHKNVKHTKQTKHKK